MFKIATERKKLKTMGHIALFITTIPGMDRWEIKQRNIHEQKNPSMKSQSWNPQTRYRVGTSPKAN